MVPVVAPISNSEFGRRVGCHHTMASRLRNGLRMPSAPMLAKILEEFHPPQSAVDELTKALAEDGGPSFVGRWLRLHVFGDPA